MKGVFRGIEIFSIVFLVGLLSILGCGRDEDDATSGVSVVSMEDLLSAEFQFPTGTSGPEWQLSDADVADILESYTSDWYEREDPEWREKGYHSQLLKDFGDVPEVRYLIAFDRYPGTPTPEQFDARHEADYRLFPNPPPSAEEKRRQERKMVEDPEAYIENLREWFIASYGDIPEVQAYLETLLKVLRGKSLTDEEWLSHNEAVVLFRKLDAEREAANS